MVVGAAVAGPAVEGGLALVLLVGFVVSLGAWYIWKSTFGRVLLWLADHIDGIAINVRVATIRPLAPLAAAFRYVDQEVMRALGAAVFSTERGAAWLFNLMRRQIEWAGHEIGALAHDVALRFERVATVDVPSAVRVATLPLRREVARIDARLHITAHAVAVEIPRALHGIRSRAATAEHTIYVTLPHTIAAERAWIGRTARQVRAHARRLARLETLFTATGAAALVAVGLRVLKLEWIRCPSLARINRRHGCMPWRLLEDVLLGSFTALAATDLCRWTGLVEAAARQVRPLLYDLVDVEEALVGCHGAPVARQVALAGYSATPVVDPIEV